jgi:NitT/TauT family transport system permease protein/taurine transport system permease protein
MMSFARKLWQGTVPFVIVVAVWQAAAMTVLYYRGVAFPTPWQTFLKLAALLGGGAISNHSLYVHIFSSLQRWLVGFAIAASLGVGYGLLAGRVKAFERATARIPQLLLLVPGLAWIPVAILLFGIGEPATIFMIAVSAFAPIAINVLAGIKDIDTHLIRAAQMMGAGKNALFFRVLIPAALPSLISGLRIGLGTGWRVLVAAEMIVGTGTGLGYSIIQARWTLDYTSSFACIAVICGIGLIFEQVVFKQLEKQTIERWTASI